MRKEYNPNKDVKQTDLMSNYRHRVVIPLYIPSIEGFHKNSLEIFKICVTSILKTTNPSTTAITIVNNGCCTIAVEYLNALFLSHGNIELIHTQSVGKLNAILKAVRSSNEDYITIADADVLFKPNWLHDTIKVFSEFNKTAVVGLTPQFKMYENYGYNVIFDNLLSKRLQFRQVKDPADMIKFYESIDWKNIESKPYLKQHLTLKQNNTEAVIGSGHFVATYKRQIFDNNIGFSNFKLGGDSEAKYLDIPCLKKGMWRLTTANNNAYHMGNILEDWMSIFLSDMTESKSVDFNMLSNKTYQSSVLGYFVKNRVFPKLLKPLAFKRMFYNFKKLDKALQSKY